MYSLSNTRTVAVVRAIYESDLFLCYRIRFVLMQGSSVSLIIQVYEYV